MLRFRELCALYCFFYYDKGGIGVVGGKQQEHPLKFQIFKEELDAEIKKSQYCMWALMMYNVYTLSEG